MTLTATSSAMVLCNSKIPSQYYQSTAKNSNSSLDQHDACIVIRQNNNREGGVSEKIFMSTRHIATHKNFHFFFCLINNFFSSSHLAASFRAQKHSRITGDDRTKLDDLDKDMLKRKAQLYEIEQSLPQKNSMYLKVSPSYQLQSSQPSLSR